MKIEILVSLYLSAIGNEGSPSGVIYAAMMSMNVGLSTHQNVVSLLTESKLAKKRGHFLTLTDKGKSLLAKIEEAKALAEKV